MPDATWRMRLRILTGRWGITWGCMGMRVWGFVGVFFWRYMGGAKSRKLNNTVCKLISYSTWKRCYGNPSLPLYETPKTKEIYLWGYMTVMSHRCLKSQEVFCCKKIVSHSSHHQWAANYNFIVIFLSPGGCSFSSIFNLVSSVSPFFSFWAWTLTLYIREKMQGNLRESWP